MKRRPLIEPPLYPVRVYSVESMAKIKLAMQADPALTVSGAIHKLGLQPERQEAQLLGELPQHYEAARKRGLISRWAGKKKTENKNGRSIA